jgi:hypothetical protein
LSLDVFIVLRISIGHECLHSSKRKCASIDGRARENNDQDPAKFPRMQAIGAPPLTLAAMFQRALRRGNFCLRVKKPAQGSRLR